jgi:hypothetical protein
VISLNREDLCYVLYGPTGLGKPKNITGDDVLIAKGQSKLSHILKEKKTGVVAFESFGSEYYYGSSGFSVGII